MQDFPSPVLDVLFPAVDNDVDFDEEPSMSASDTASIPGEMRTEMACFDLSRCVLPLTSILLHQIHSDSDWSPPPHRSFRRRRSIHVDPAHLPVTPGSRSVEDSIVAFRQLILSYNIRLKAVSG